MENHAEDPGREAEVAEPEIEFAERVGGRDGGFELGNAPAVREVVEQGEEDGEGLLHAEEAVEGPFAVELQDRV